MEENREHHDNALRADALIELEDVLLRIEELRNSRGDPQEIADLVDYSIQLVP